LINLRNYIAILILVVTLSGIGRSEVILRGSLADAEGVRWASEQLAEVQLHAKVRMPGVVAEIGKNDLKVDDGYVIKPLSRNKVLLQANSEGGVMYGLLDIKNRINEGRTPAIKTTFKPSLRLRGICENLPFWAGSRCTPAIGRYLKREKPALTSGGTARMPG
jgi:hypothetical protein